MYGSAGENAFEANRLYQEPQCHPSSANTIILRCVQRLRDTGNVIARGGRGQQVNLNVEDTVLQNLEEVHTNSTLRLAQ